jgi:hypothetical protein
MQTKDRGSGAPDGAAELFCAYLDDDLSLAGKQQLENNLLNPDFLGEWQSLLNLHNTLGKLGEDILSEPIPECMLRLVRESQRTV